MKKLEQEIKEAEDLLAFGRANINLTDRFGNISENCLNNAVHNLLKIKAQTGGLDVKGRRILDIGCGALMSKDQFLPTTARMLQAMGASVTGIDKTESPGEPYEHIVMDLEYKSLHSRFEKQEFDMVVCCSFFDSPALPLHLLNKDFAQRISEEAFELLKPGGFFVYDFMSMAPAEYGAESEARMLREIGFEVEMKECYTKRDGEIEKFTVIESVRKPK